MATSAEITTIQNLAKSKNYNIFFSGNVIGTGAGVGTFHVDGSPSGHIFKSNFDLTTMTNHLNTF